MRQPDDEAGPPGAPGDLGSDAARMLDLLDQTIAALDAGKEPIAAAYVDLARNLVRERYGIG